MKTKSKLPNKKNTKKNNKLEKLAHSAYEQRKHDTYYGQSNSIVDVDSV